jgi:hypothetical protein
MKSSKPPSLSPPFGGADGSAATEDGDRHKRRVTIRAAIPAPTRAPRRKLDSDGFTRLSTEVMMRMLPENCRPGPAAAPSTNDARRDFGLPARERNSFAENLITHSRRGGSPAAGSGSPCPGAEGHSFPTCGKSFGEFPGNRTAAVESKTSRRRLPGVRRTKRRFRSRTFRL